MQHYCSVMLFLCAAVMLAFSSNIRQPEVDQTLGIDSNDDENQTSFDSLDLESSSSDDENQASFAGLDMESSNEDENQASFAGLDIGSSSNNQSEVDQTPERDANNDEIQMSSSGKMENAVHIALAACGDVGPQTDQATTLIKSALIMTSAKLYFHIFADPTTHHHFAEQLDSWQRNNKEDNQFFYQLYEPKFPSSDSMSSSEWRSLFAPCSSLRLFMPEMLAEDVERVIYIDTDAIFLQPPEALWDYFHLFNSSHVAALVTNHDMPDISWYYYHSRIPHYPAVGLNAGVILMDIAGLRKSKWQENTMSYFNKYGDDMPWKDQDAINIFFSFNSEKLLLMPCKWNYRVDHCKYMPHCASAQSGGIGLLHGSRGVFYNQKEVVFKALYRIFLEHDLLEPVSGLVGKIKEFVADSSEQERYHHQKINNSQCFEAVPDAASWILRHLTEGHDEL